MTDFLKNEGGCEAIMDDIMVYEKSAEEHDENLRKTLEIIEESGLELNREKCEFKKDRLTFFGHILSADRVSPDPEKVKAIRELGAPNNVLELRRVMGMINYLGRFILNISQQSMDSGIPHEAHITTMRMVPQKVGCKSPSGS